VVVTVDEARVRLASNIKTRNKANCGGRVGYERRGGGKKIINKERGGTGNLSREEAGDEEGRKRKKIKTPLLSLFLSFSEHF
jgi:hypothetical protein